MADELKFRLANGDDAFALMRLHQLAAPRPLHDPLMLDYGRLQSLLTGKSTDSWFVGEDARTGELVVGASVMHDTEQRLAKMHRLYVAPSVEDMPAATKGVLSFLLAHLDAQGETDVLYTATWKLTLAQLELTREMGFRTAGIFPNVPAADVSRVNSITVYFFRDVLTTRRFTDFTIHPAVRPFFDLVRRECNLPNVADAVIDPAAARAPSTYTLSDLEVINAAKFVAYRFDLLKERKFLSVSFYPFQEPDVLITVPRQEVEIFVRMIPKLRFAMIIGEKVNVPVDPSLLYRAVGEILNEKGITYIEMLNDAADVSGTQFLLQAGYIPCVYFPCLKTHGNLRRDIVVFGKSFEKGRLRPEFVGPQLREFWDHYWQLDHDLLQARP